MHHPTSCIINNDIDKDCNLLINYMNKIMKITRKYEKEKNCLRMKYYCKMK